MKVVFINVWSQFFKILLFMLFYVVFILHLNSIFLIINTSKTQIQIDVK